MAESENRRSDEGRSGADRSGPPARSRSLLVAVLLSIAGFTLLLIGMTTANASLSSRAVAQPTDNVTLCHRTASHSNPYVVITVDPAGAYNGHYLEHTGPIFPATGSDGKWGDIIPPFMFQGQTYSRNWPEGEAIFNNGCRIPGQPSTPVTTPTTPATTPVTTPTTPESTRVTLCHRTGSESNPYVEITVSAAGAFNGHYSEHQGPIFPERGPDGKWGDIISPFVFQGQTFSLNWDTEGMAIFENDCKIPAPTTSPVTTPSTPETTPTTPVTPTTPT